MTFAGERPSRAPLTGPGPAEPATDRIPGEWLVKVTPEVTIEQLMERYRSLGLMEVRPVMPNLFLLRFAPERTPSEAEIRKVGGPGIVLVQPNFRYRALTPQ